MNHPSAMHVVAITGMSGSGKSVAVNALEDLGYYCVDNLPPELIQSLVDVERARGLTHLAIGVDVRSAESLHLVPDLLAQLKAKGMHTMLLFLDATSHTLVRRFSETRRRHPLSGEQTNDERRALIEAIALEQEVLAPLREHAVVVDSSLLRPAQLQEYVKSLVQAPSDQLTLVFESFAFKRGVPMDADFVFDVRMLPNPHYEPELRALTGRDAPVIDYLAADPSVAQMAEHIAGFLKQWLPPLQRDHRSYVTVGIGCTGGQHRSVFLVELLTEHFSADWRTLKRHRELDGHGPGSRAIGRRSAELPANQAPST